tara:strand:+ start:257 stop:493 length:237 start_codon:yes stop_codon:yes gene_type:complete
MLKELIIRWLGIDALTDGVCELRHDITGLIDTTEEIRNDVSTCEDSLVELKDGAAISEAVSDHLSNVDWNDHIEVRFS